MLMWFLVNSLKIISPSMSSGTVLYILTHSILKRSSKYSSPKKNQSKNKRHYLCNCAPLSNIFITYLVIFTCIAKST